MKLKNVLIVYKKSTFQIQALEHRESRFLKLLEEGSDTVTRVKVAHSEHYDTLEQIQAELTRRKIAFTALARADLNRLMQGVDLVISVGGDGTFLDASHFLADLPLLGVNSSRSSSFGHFCLANESNFKQVLDEIESGKRQPERLLRLELRLNGSVLPETALNEVLISHSCPAGTSRYFLKLGDKREEQRSSGIWIGPPAGSTGAIRAAGGQILPIMDQSYQYVVREPWHRPGEYYELKQGLLESSQEMLIVSQMRTGAIYIDGQHIDYCFGLGDELIIKGSSKPLLAYVFPDLNNMFRENIGEHRG